MTKELKLLPIEHLFRSRTLGSWRSCFSVRIRSSNATAGSLLRSWGTNSPQKALERVACSSRSPKPSQTGYRERDTLVS